MISEQQFISEFNRLEASFSRTLSEKLRDAWYEQVRRTNPEVFKVAMRHLIYGERFPNFGAYKTAVGLAKHEIAYRETNEPGCEYCVGGVLHVMAYRDKDGKEIYENGRDRSPGIGGLGDSYDVSLWCRVCYPTRRGNANPHKAWKFAEGMAPSDHRNKTMIPAPIAKAMIQELQDKMTRGNVDWDKEVKDAWALHEKAELETNNDH